MVHGTKIILSIPTAQSEVVGNMYAYPKQVYYLVNIYLSNMRCVDTLKQQQQKILKDNR